MTEYEIYLPTTTNDGAPIPAGKIDAIKEALVNAFGGYTHFFHRYEGAWSVGGVTFHDAVTILRVLDTGNASFDMAAFKRKLQKALRQESILIVRRDLEILE